jgi:hypothetical protein
VTGFISPLSISLAFLTRVFIGHSLLSTPLRCSGCFW